MPAYKYLIIGGGMTADSAVKGIRQVDPSGSIGIVSAEQHPPYNRPPLSKGLWKDTPLDKIWRKTEGAEIHLSRNVTSIDVSKKSVVDDKGTTYQYQKLLLATGGSPTRFPMNFEGVLYFRTLDDYHTLRAATGRGKSFAVIGGGFIGSEVAAALAMNDKRVTMIFPEDGICARVFPPSLSAFLNSFYESKGVAVRAKESLAGITKRRSTYVVKTATGTQFSVDGVVAGIGIRPNVELAKLAGLKVDNGIVVDELLQTNAADIYAAGDVANFFNPALGKRIRVEHEDNANAMGEIAGKNMAGGGVLYHHLPFFYSDLFELGYEAVGELDARYEVVEDWKEQFREGVLYYLNEGRVRGVLLWNVWGQVGEARKLIAEPGPLTALSVKGRLPSGG